MAARRRIALELDPDKVVGLGVEGIDPPEAPTQAFRILRPDDLVSLEVRCFRCTLSSGQRRQPPELTATRDGAWIEVRFAFQHLGERAWYRVEQPSSKVVFWDDKEARQAQGDPPDLAASNEPVDPPPIEVRAANSSRLCLDLASEERIEFTIEGVLEAISRLPLRVSEWATPRPRPAAAVADLLGIVAELPGASLVRTDTGLAFVSNSAARRELGAADLSATRRTSTAGDVLSTANGLRLARTVLLGERADRLGRVDLGPDFSELVGDIFRPPRLRDRVPRAPRADQTAIEAPYRLIISPSRRGGFRHATKPVAVDGKSRRIELWHSRLGVRSESAGDVRVDEAQSPQKIIRAIWARDLEPRNDDDIYDATDELGAVDPLDLLKPFRMSLDGRDRGMLVRQTADPTIAEPRPVDVHRLYLSALGAWLDLHVDWSAEEIKPYAKHGDPSVLAWDEVAPMGRDQYVRVAYPGYLFPFGHLAALIKVTERKVLERADPQARLYQRKFLVIPGPVRGFDQRDLPFKQVRLLPTVTPDIDDPLLPGTPHTASFPGISRDQLFWPVVGGEKFRFTLDCLDHAGRPARFHAPLLFVAAHLGRSHEIPLGAFSVTIDEKSLIRGMYGADGTVDGLSRHVAISRPTVSGDTTLEVRSFDFTGQPGDPGDLSSRPSMSGAKIVIPALRQLAPQAAEVPISYARAFLDNGFAAGNEGQVFAEVVGAGAKVLYDSTARSGGLIAPNLPIEGISKTLGPVGDVDAIAQGHFEPKDFLASLGDSMPKLFGIVDLVDLLDAAGLGGAPRLVSELLDGPAAMVADIGRLGDALDAASARLASGAEGIEPAQLTKLNDIRTETRPLVDNILASIKNFQKLAETADKPAVKAALETPLRQLNDQLGDLDRLLAEAELPPPIRVDLQRLVGALKTLFADAEAIKKSIEQLLAMFRGIFAGSPSVRARYEWKPRLRSWPADAAPPIIEVPTDGFTLSLEARASASGDAGFDSVAELRDLSVNLLPGFPLISLQFERIAFRAAGGRKSEVDVLFGGIEFKGILQFVQTLSEVIPLDALSDPPRVEVDASSATAGVDVALPNIAVGVFSLENISLGTDAKVPFLGEAVTIGFHFCTRERPFCLTVMALGGGGFVGLRASPKGLVLLEGSLEFGAHVSLDFGVASGSVEVMGGVYYKQEDTTSTLTGYVRLRGEVSLLAIASVSLTAELSLTYRTKGGGKDEMFGEAKVTLEVEIALIEYSASFSIERHFAGSNGDPTFAQLITVAADGSSPPWSEYCLAFAED